MVVDSIVSRNRCSLLHIYSIRFYGIAIYCFTTSLPVFSIPPSIHNHDVSCVGDAD